MTTASLTGRINITVHGKPITQGSKTRSRYALYDDNSHTLKPWREAVKCAAIDATRHHDRLDGPVKVILVFTFDKPRSAPKRRRTWPVTRGSGDVDKLTRACFDALTDAGVWRDDAQVVDVRARKVFVDEDDLALPTPGVRIQISEVTL